MGASRNPVVSEYSDSYRGQITDMVRAGFVDIACRGQHPDFNGEMKARLDRCVELADLSDRLRIERAICQRFREQAPIYLSPVEHRYLATRWLQLVVMQHYGAPTRLLDWTKSPWVAAFFAVSDGWQSDGYVYIFRRDRLERRLRERFAKELNPPGDKRLIWGPHPSNKGFSGAWRRAPRV